MHLQFLIFDASDDGEGTGTWEAMASVQAHNVPAATTEAQAVVSLAQASAPGPQGPLDDGGIWDADQQVTQDGDWTTLTLTLTGPWEWGEALIRELETETGG